MQIIFLSILPEIDADRSLHVNEGSTYHPRSASLRAFPFCALRVFCRSNSHYFSLHSSLWFKRKERKDIRKVRKDAAAYFFLSAAFAGLPFAPFAFSAFRVHAISFLALLGHLPSPLGDNL